MQKTTVRNLSVLLLLTIAVVALGGGRRSTLSAPAGNRAELDILIASTRAHINTLPLPELRRRHQQMQQFAARYKATGDLPARADANRWSALLGDLVRHRQRHQAVRLLAPSAAPEGTSLFGPVQRPRETEPEDEVPLI